VGEQKRSGREASTKGDALPRPTRKDSELEEQLKVGFEFMKRYERTFRALAKRG